MIRTLALALTTALTATAAPAAPPDDQLLAAVERELPHYVPGADVRGLPRVKLAAIHQIIHSSRSASDKTALIRSALGGRFSLRTLLFD